MTNANLTSDVLKAVISGKHRAPEISKFIFGNVNSVRSALARLHNRGQIVRVSRGNYFVTQLPASFSDEDVQGWYLSGLQYTRNIGVKIFGLDLDINEAELILRSHMENVEHYNHDFYGIGEIRYNHEQLDKVIEVNL